ncbi:MAG: hypothetical protein HZB33_14395 [Nitrospirae bacterium]|nr:hypothetical protein [Nitrospirota bacterium]
MKIKLWSAYLVICLLLISHTQKSECATQQNRIKFEAKVTKIDIKKGTPNFPQLTQDGSALLYLTPLNHGEYTLWRLSPSSLEARVAVSNVPSPFIASDGKSTAYVKDHQLHILDIETKKSKIVPLPRTFKTSANLYSVIWSPNGRFIALYSVASSTTRIWIYDIGQRAFRKVTEVQNPSKTPPEAQSYSYLSGWSPNSQALAYPVFYDDKTEYFITQVEDGVPKKIDILPNVAVAEPSWTMQNYILWYGYDKNKMSGDNESADFSELYVVNVLTRKMNKINIKNITSAWYPVLSPNGRWLVFYAKDINNELKLLLTDLVGSFIEVLDDKITPGQAPKWTPDSKSVVYDKLLDSGAITLGVVTISSAQ